MPDATLNHLGERDLGEPERRVVLKKSPRIELCQWDDYVALMELAGDGHVRRRQVDALTHLQIQSSALHSTLHLAEHSFSLFKKPLSDALELIAAARLWTQGNQRGAPPQIHVCRLVRAPTLAQRAALQTMLEADESLLAWLPTSTTLTGTSDVLGQWHADAQFLLTDQRAMLVSLSKVGDLESLALPKERLSRDGKHLRCGTVRWISSEAPAMDGLADACGMDPTARLVEVARQLWISEPGEAEKLFARHILQSAEQLGDGRAPLLLSWLWSGIENPTNWPHAADSALNTLWAAWKMPVAAGRQLLARWPRQNTHAQSACDLSRALWDAERTAARQPSDAAQADLDHAELLLDYRLAEQAGPLLRARRSQLPAVGLGDIELPTGLASSELRGLRRRLERLALRASGDNQQARTQVLQRLVTLDPLNPQWLEQLADGSAQPVADRARIALQVLHESATLSAPPSLERPNVLTAEYLSLLPHPLIEPHRQTLSKVQALIAKEQKPDFSTLRLYCERVTQIDSEVTRAVDDAATLLGLGHVDAYISRGDDDVGCRAFRAQATFLLLGGQHVDPESRYFMSPRQLRFVVGSELAHLKLEHVRVAPRDVLSGAWDKGKHGLDLALSVLPILKGLKLANKIGIVTAKLSLPQMGRAMSAARALTQAVDRAQHGDDQRTDISTANEELIVAHRLMQLSADRAGLLCADSLPAAVTALLLNRSDYVRASNELAALGVLKSVNKQRHGHSEAYDDLLTRLGELTSFYVSDTFELLRSAVHPATQYGDGSGRS